MRSIAVLTLLEQKRNRAIRNMLARVPPTLEDQIVIRRNWDRMLRWTAGMETMAAVRVLNRWCDDYLHNRFET